MKSNRRIKTILIILGIFFAFSPIFINNPSFSNRTDNMFSDNLKISKLSGKIHIINNLGWEDFRNDGNCTGSGTYSDPYVIEDLEIDGAGMGSPIWIENSSVYFKIENCSVYRSGWNWYDAGICLSYVNNSQLINNTCSSNNNGILLLNSNNNSISGNTATDNIIYGIYLIWSNYSTVSGNIADNNEYAGIRLLTCDNNEVMGNTVINNLDGIHLAKSHNSTVSGNTAISNYCGIFLAPSLKVNKYNMISDNNISDNLFYGISLIQSNNTIVLENNVINNFHGIHLAFSNSTEISGNIANYNVKEGIYLSDSNLVNISGNTANYNQYGVYLKNSNNNIVSGNTLIGNDECIAEVDCQGNEFSDNGDCTYGQDNDGGFAYNLFLVIGIPSFLLLLIILISKKIKKSNQ